MNNIQEFNNNISKKTNEKIINEKIKKIYNPLKDINRSEFMNKLSNDFLKEYNKIMQ